MDANNDGKDTRLQDFMDTACINDREMINDRYVLSPLPTGNVNISKNIPNFGIAGNNQNVIMRNKSLETEQGMISTPASILKRVRRIPGKENDNQNVNQNHTNQGHKRVRIVSPDKKSLYCKGQREIVSAKTNLISQFEDDDDFEVTVVSNVGKKAHMQDDKIINTRNIIGDVLQSDIICIGKEELHNVHEATGTRTYDPTGKTILVQPVKKRRRNKKDFKDWLLVRFQPKVLSDAVTSMTDKQKKWVKSTGFGSILSFRMNQYPQALSYYLVQAFKTHPVSLCVEDSTIPIEDDDVNEVLGLPKGTENVQIMKSDHIEQRWLAQFTTLQSGSTRVTANMVCEAIRNSTDVDRMFKLNFLVLLSNILVEGPTNSHVRKTILGFTGDLDNCNKYNWCTYLINHLKTSYLSWNENPKAKYYTGSISLLVYLYMDRVLNGKRQVRRKKPTFIGWSDSLLLDRQISDISTDSFFHGKIALPLRYKDSDDESSYEDCTWNTIVSNSSDDEEVGCEYKTVQRPSDIEHNTNVLHCIPTDGKNCSEENVDAVAKNKMISSNRAQLLTQTEMKGKNLSISEPEIPRYVIDNLKVSIEDYEKIQKKCMLYLLSAKELFKNNRLVNSLESRFISLLEKASEFVRTDIGKSDVLKENYCINEMKITTSRKEEDKLSNFTTPVTHVVHHTSKVVSPLDEDLGLTIEDWRYIDSLSNPKDVKGLENTSEVFTILESQTKSLPLCKSNSSSGFNTPGSGQTTKATFDATIPSFSLGVDDLDIPEGKSDFQGKEDAIKNEEITARPKRDVKKSDFQKSPYMERITNIHGKNYKKEETDLWNWLHSNRQYPNRALFKWEEIVCYKVDFQSMKDGDMVLTSVIDVWACFLNSQEEFRSGTSPSRLFCYIETTIGSLNSFNDRTSEKKYRLFEENMEHIMSSFKSNLIGIDLVFFPIFQSNHYYVVCFNLKNPSIEILDNRKSNHSIKALYGNTVLVLQKLFTSYMVKMNHPKAMEVCRLDAERLVMQWQTTDNDVDCGIFAMRHMETYMGGGARTWISKLVPQGYTQKKNISRLRLLFTYRMISCPLNYLYPVILDEIKYPNMLG